MIISPLMILLILIAVGIYFTFRTINKRARDHQNSLNELKKSEEITKNGVVVNAADETEQYSVKKCPSCAEEINKEATKCKHCGERIGKGYEIIADGTYVANKIRGQWKGISFKVVWITLIVLLVMLFSSIQLGMLR